MIVFDCIYERIMLVDCTEHRDLPPQILSGKRDMADCVYTHNTHNTHVSKQRCALRILSEQLRV